MPAVVSCKRCQKEQHRPDGRAEITLRDLQGTGLELRGVLRCLCTNCVGHEWPIVIRHDEIYETAPTLPVSEAAKLHADVPDGIKEDILEAQRAHFYQLHKASAVMCRRAIQLALEAKLHIPGLTLGRLLLAERKGQSHLLSDQSYQLAERIKGYGDAGAHKTQDLDPTTIGVIIHDTVVALNELYSQPPASQ